MADIVYDNGRDTLKDYVWEESTAKELVPLSLLALVWLQAYNGHPIQCIIPKIYTSGLIFKGLSVIFEYHQK